MHGLTDPRALSAVGIDTARDADAEFVTAAKSIARADRAAIANDGERAGPARDAGLRGR